MIQIAAGIFLVVGGIALIVFGAANHIASPAMVKFVGVESVTMESTKTGAVEDLHPEERIYLRPGSSLTVTNKGEVK